MTNNKLGYLKTHFASIIVAACAILLARAAWATTWYVDAATGSSSHSGKSMSDAFASIQTAINKASVDDLIVVNDGTYDPITVNQRITIQSVNGYAKSIIDGRGSQRCATLWSGNSAWSTNSILIGFTLQNGYDSQYGGGVRAGTLYDCLITGCRTAGYGGGGYDSELHNCIIENNKNTGSYGCGGGVCECDVFNCIVRNNKSYDGAGVYSGCSYSTLIVGNVATARGGGCLGGRLRNCTLVNNIAPTAGGDAWGNLINCVVWGNYTSNSKTVLCNFHPDYVYHEYTCTYPKVTGRGNMAEDPCFVDINVGDYRLRADSPCLDRGVNLQSLSNYESILVDVLNLERIRNDRIDLGAYENQTGSYPHSKSLSSPDEKLTLS